MLTIAPAIIEHSCRIMFFRHDGSGLPNKKGGLLYVLLGVAVLGRMLRDVVDPGGFSAAGSVVACGAYVLLTMFMFRPPIMAALLLANTFGYAVVGGLYLAGISNGYIRSALMIWELVALVVVLHKIVRRAQANHKKQPSLKD